MTDDFEELSWKNVVDYMDEGREIEKSDAFFCRRVFKLRLSFERIPSLN
jgi:hypothetical protein